MALVPLKNPATITPIIRDEWERDVEGTPYTLKCRIQEGTKLVRSASDTNGVHGVTAQETVSTAQLYFDKLARAPNGEPIKLTDKFTITDEYGNTRTYTPISIEIKRGLNGKALLTVVNV